MGGGNKRCVLCTCIYNPNTVSEVYTIFLFSLPCVTIVYHAHTIYTYIHHKHIGRYPGVVWLAGRPHMYSHAINLPHLLLCEVQANQEVNFARNIDRSSGQME